MREVIPSFFMTKDWIKDIPNWEKEYPTMEGVKLSNPKNKDRTFHYDN